MPSPLPEIIELLITNERTASGRTFYQVMDQFIQRIPSIHSTSKQPFFIGYFLGGLYNFQYTQLKRDLQVTSTLWKFDRTTHTLDLAFSIHPPEQQEETFILRSIMLFNEQDLTGATAQGHPNQHLFSDQALMEITYQNQINHEAGFTLRKKFLHTIPPTGLPLSIQDVKQQLTAAGFQEITAATAIKSIDEETITQFSALTIDEVKQSVQAYLLGHEQLLHHARDELFKQIGSSIETEAFLHGFLYGGLNLNFKNRYYLDCYAERIAGSGYADIIAISRARGQRTNSIPIIIELKAGGTNAEEAIAQIKEKGYFQHVLSLRTYHKQAVIAGMNMCLAPPETGSQADAIIVQTADIPHQNTMDAILTAVVDRTTHPSTAIATIQTHLMHLYHSRLGKLELSYFFLLLVGQAIAYQSKHSITPIKKTVFIPSEVSFNNRYGFLAIEFEHSGAKQTLVFEVLAKTGVETRHTKHPFDRANTPLNALCAQYTDSSHPVQKITIHIDPSQSGSPFLQTIQLETISFDPALASYPLRGTLQPLPALNFHDFFQPKFQDATEYRLHPAIQSRLTDALYPLRTLLQRSLPNQRSEFSAQAIMQGIASGLQKEGQDIRVFAEANHSAQGRADLIITIATPYHQGNAREETLVIFELKAALSKRDAEQSVDRALHQAKKYVSNVKSLTDAHVAQVMGLVINSHASVSGDFLHQKSALVAIEHASTDERMEWPEQALSPHKKTGGQENQPIKKRCRRNISACRFDYPTDDTDELTEDLMRARIRGTVLSIADIQAILLSMVKGSTHKLLIVDDHIRALAVVSRLLSLATSSTSAADWLQQIKMSFPLEATLLQQHMHQDGLDFNALKEAFTAGRIQLSHIKWSQAHEEDDLRRRLGIEGEVLSALYLGHRELSETSSDQISSRRQQFKKQLLSLLSDETELYRQATPDSLAITLYRGPRADLEQAWEQRPLTPHPTSKQAMHTLLATLKAAQEWGTAIKTANHADGIPLLETAEEKEGNKEIVHFFSPATQTEQQVTLEGQHTIAFRKQLRQLYQQIRSIVHFEKGTPEWLEDPIGHAETIDGLNAAFTIQAVFHFFEQKNRESLETDSPPLTTAIEIHNYLNLVQMAYGTIVDTTKVIQLVKTLLRDEAAPPPLSAFTSGLKQWALEGPGVLLAGASVVLDSIELKNAQTEAEKAVFSTQLTFDTGGLLLSAASMGAVYAGASSTATMLGGSTVLLAGLGVGTTALVQAFNQVAASVQAVGAYFFHLDRAYQAGGYEVITTHNQSIMSPLYGAVVTDINFQEKTISYGSPRIYRTHHGKTGSGKINYFFWAGDFPVVVHDKEQALNIRDEWGYPQQRPLESWHEVLTWELPTTAEVYINYGWQALAFATTRNDAGLKQLRELEKEGKIDVDFYAFPSEYIINSIHEEHVATTLQVTLDTKDRTLIMPAFAAKDQYLPPYLHYRIDSPAAEGRCTMILHPVGSLTLTSHHPHYTWVLQASDHSIEQLTFTVTGIQIGPVAITLPTPTLGQYQFVDRQGNGWMLDWQQQTVTLVKANFQWLQKQTSVPSTSLRKNGPATTVLIDDFPLIDDQGSSYNGTAYYAPSEDHYFYTQGLPPTLTGARFVGCVAEACYFFKPPHFLWRTNKQTHQVEKKYVFYTPTTHADHFSSEIKSITIAAEGIVTVTQQLKNETKNTVQQLTYQIIQDQDPLLVSIADDELLTMLHHTPSPLDIASSFNTLQPTSPWDDHPTLSGTTAIARTDTTLAMTALARENPLTTLWVRKQADHYQLIDPHLTETQLVFLGSLLTPTRSEIFYFFRPARGQASAQLYRQPAGKIATPLGISITQAFWSQNTLFVLTPTHLVQAIDALGHPRTVGVTAEWMQAHANQWWEAVPALLRHHHKGRHHLALYGLTDQTGQALGAWYDASRQSFLFATLPTRTNHQPFHMVYLGTVAQHHLFFSENGVLYQQPAYPILSRSAFQGTRLQDALAPAPLQSLATGLKAAYLRHQQLWVYDQAGRLFSFDPRLPALWYLEKLSDSPQGSNQPNVTTWLHTEWANVTDITHSNDTITPIHFDPAAPVIATHDQRPIPIEHQGKQLWWSPDQQTFFYPSPHQTTSERAYLGLCTETRNKTSGACFFNGGDRRIDLIPNHPLAYPVSIPTTLALRLDTYFLFISPKPPHPLKQAFPLLKGATTLGLYFSSQDSAYIFQVPPALMNHYQKIIYQISTPWMNALSLTYHGSSPFAMQKHSPDLIMLHPDDPCQWIFPQAAALVHNPFNGTSINIRYTNQTSGAFYTETFTKLGEELQQQDTIWLNNQPITAKLSTRVHHVQSASLVIEEQAAITREPSAAFSRPYSLSAIGGIIATGVGYLFIKRFRHRTVTAITLFAPNTNAQAVARYEHAATFQPSACAKSNTPLGLLGYCSHPQEVVFWWQTTPSSLTGYAWGNRTTIIKATLESSRLSFHRAHGTTQTLDLEQMRHIPLSRLFPHLPPVLQQQLQATWQQVAVMQRFAQQAQHIGYHYVGRMGLLHTPLGDVFKALGLTPRWDQRDDERCLARWLMTVQYRPFGPLATLTAALLETALLHPRIQQGCRLLTGHAHERYAKHAVRFIADLLQLGLHPLIHLPSTLELVFADYPPIHAITWGLRAIGSLLALTHDFRYYYLGMALFVLPHLPVLLEHMGIPVTRYLSQALKNLSSVLILQSLWPIEPDQERLIQQAVEQQAAEQRVAAGRQRLTTTLSPVIGFFQSHPHPSSDSPGSREPRFTRVYTEQSR